VVEASQVPRPGHEALDVEDRLTDEQGRDALKRGYRTLGRKGGNRFADADQTVVGLDFDQHDGGRVVGPSGPVGGLLEGQSQRRGLDGGDLHRRPLCVSRMMRAYMVDAPPTRARRASSRRAVSGEPLSRNGRAGGVPDKVFQINRQPLEACHRFSGERHRE
jgi:hypothetical protein